MYMGLYNTTIRERFNSTLLGKALVKSSKSRTVTVISEAVAFEMVLRKQKIIP